MKRVLFIGEASYLSTGYGKYAKEILSRLCDDYEVAEFSIYGGLQHEKWGSQSWKSYPNMPLNSIEDGLYNSHPLNQFGLWRYNWVVNDFRPHVVIDIRDWWMMSFEEYSPFSNTYHWSIMPTVDSIPQMPQWLATFTKADSVATYSEFAYNYLKETQGSYNSINLQGVASPCADYKIFKPTLCKSETRRHMGLSEDSFIVGTVMRNQVRKLFPELIQHMEELCKRYPNMYLYLHTKYPDIGWNIPSLLKRSSIGDRILFTYLCMDCGHIMPRMFTDSIMFCDKCGGLAQMPGVDDGVSEHQLASILNCFDVYVQYALCEGFGMPQLEAAGCGLPVVAVNYSAMESVTSNIGGYKVDPAVLFTEGISHAKRAYPNREQFEEHIASLHQELDGLSNEEYADRRKHNAQVARDAYSWDKAASVWRNIIDGVDETQYDEEWEKPPSIHEPIPMEGDFNELHPLDFIHMCEDKILGSRRILNNYTRMKMARDVFYGAIGDGECLPGLNEASVGNSSRATPYGYETAINEMTEIRKLFNYFEEVRCGLNKDRPNFLDVAHNGSVRGKDCS